MNTFGSYKQELTEARRSHSNEDSRMRELSLELKSFLIKIKKEIASMEKYFPKPFDNDPERYIKELNRTNMNTRVRKTKDLLDSMEEVEKQLNKVGA